MSEIKVLDHGYIKLVESWGSDEKFIEAARMSTSGSFRGWDTDERLLRYLWAHQHHTPFEMGGVVFEAQCPIFVAREWFRHRTQSFNELSARYVELPDLCYVPSIERLMKGKQAAKNKQASEGGFDESEARFMGNLISDTYKDTRHSYEMLLQQGVAREIARLVIPVGQYTRFRASANVRNWLHFLRLRLDPSAQWEIRQYAEAIHDIMGQIFPKTLSLFDEENLGQTRQGPA